MYELYFLLKTSVFYGSAADGMNQQSFLAVRKAGEEDPEQKLPLRSDRHNEFEIALQKAINELSQGRGRRVVSVTVTARTNDGTTPIEYMIVTEPR